VLENVLSHRNDLVNDFWLAEFVNNLWKTLNTDQAVKITKCLLFEHLTLNIFEHLRPYVQQNAKKIGEEVWTFKSSFFYIWISTSPGSSNGISSKSCRLKPYGHWLQKYLAKRGSLALFVGHNNYLYSPPKNFFSHLSKNVPCLSPIVIVSA